MNKTLLAAARLQLTLLFVVFAQVAAAQGAGSVVESQPFTPGQNRSAPPSSATNSNDALSLLLEQNQQMRSELQALRGLVEEQGFELRKIQRDALSRYTNVDERLSSLESAPASVASGNNSIPSNPRAELNTRSPNNAAAVNSVGRPVSERTAINTRPGLTTTPRSSSIAAANSATAPPTRELGRSRGGLQPAVLSEQQLYQRAYDSVINSKFDVSIAEFDQYLSVYPAGRFVTNAYYWKGQAYLYLSRFEQARDSYEIIVNQYEDSAKLPDAMYGLGLAYEGLGNIPQAKRTLNDIKRRFPNTGVANLADTRLLSLD